MVQLIALPGIRFNPPSESNTWKRAEEEEEDKVLSLGGGERKKVKAVFAAAFALALDSIVTTATTGAFAATVTGTTQPHFGKVSLTSFLQSLSLPCVRELSLFSGSVVMSVC